MRTTIYKYKLTLDALQTKRIPKYAKILDAQVQHGDICIWCLQETDAQRVSRTFELFGRGHPISGHNEEKRKYIGTFQMNGGDYVYHLFEKLY